MLEFSSLALSWHDAPWPACVVSLSLAAAGIVWVAVTAREERGLVVPALFGLIVAFHGSLSVLAAELSPAPHALKPLCCIPASASVALLLLGLGIMCLASRRLFLAGQALTITSAVVAASAALTLAYRDQVPFYEIALEIVLVAVSAAALLLDREDSLRSLLRGHDLGARSARTMLPLALLFPPLLDVATGVAHGARFGDAPQHALHTGLTASIATTIVLFFSSWLRRTDADRHQALLDLAGSESRMRLQIRRMPIACIVMDRSACITAWNPASERIFGYTEAEAVGHDIIDLLVPERSRSHVEGIRDRLLAGDSDAHSVNANRTKDGRELLCAWSNTPLINDEGQVTGILSMVQDVTEKLTTERNLRESEERYRDLVDHSGDLICTHDLEGNIRSVNPSAERALGYDGSTLVRMNVRDILAPDARMEFDSYVQALLREDRAEGTMTVITRDGSRRAWQYRNTLKRKHGQPFLVRGVARDVTEERIAKRELRSTEQRYRMLFENHPQATLVVDDETDAIVAVNEAAVRQFACKRDELQGKNVYEVLAPEERAEIARRRREPEPTRRFVDVRFLRENGPPFSADVAAAAITHAGRPSRLVVIADVTERTHAQSELREATWFNEEIIASAGEGIVIFDRNLQLLVWNRFMEWMTGQAAESVVGAGAASIAPFSEERVEAALRQTLTDGLMNILEFKTSLAEQDRWLLQVSLPHRNASGAVMGVIAVISDITAQKQTEESLQKSEELHRSIIESTPNAIFSLDLEDRFTSANRELCVLLGCAAAEILGRSLFDFEAFTWRREEWISTCAQARSSRAPVPFQCEARTAQGTTATHEGTVTPLFDATGAVTALSVVSHDITERLRTAESLKRLSHAVEQASEVIFMTDREGRITYTNPAFESVYGFTRPETIGNTPRLLKSGVYSQADYEQFWATILAGKAAKGEVVNRRKDGSFVTVERSVSPIFDAEGRITGFLSVQTDITDRKQIEADREMLQERMAHIAKMEAIGTLAGGIAHDFNNILAAILSFCTVAERSRDDEGRFRYALETIRRAVGRGADLSKRILTFARRAETKVAAVDVNFLISEVVKMARETFPRTIAIEAHLGGNVPHVIADESQLHQGLMNLFINARDAMTGGGSLRVSTATVSGDAARRSLPDTTDARYVEIRITDTGVGMSDETRQRIFEPFFTTKTDGRGTGLGLAVTYGAVKTASGFITVESEIGSGTTFSILLPAPVMEQPSAENAPAVVESKSGTETILLVEDEEAIAEVMADELRAHGYEVIAADNGFTALELFKEHEAAIDLVISDDGLPQIAGRDLFVLLRARVPALPFILVSGFVDPESMDTLNRLGVNQFLQKPYSIDDLLNAARTVLDAVNVPA